MRLKDLFESVEQWRPVVGWSRYEVSNTGKVREAGTNKPVAQWDHTGRGTTYKRVTLRQEGYRKGARVHQLVARAFLPNPDHLPEVDHKDGNPFNNHVSNLEWVSSSQNLYRRDIRQQGIKQRSILDVKKRR